MRERQRQSERLQLVFGSAGAFVAMEEREEGGLYAHLITCKLNLIETSIQSVTRTNQLAAFPMFLYSDLWHYYHLHWTRKRPCLAAVDHRNLVLQSLGDLCSGNWLIDFQSNNNERLQTFHKLLLIDILYATSLPSLYPQWGCLFGSNIAPHKHRSIPRGDSPHTLTHVN